MGGSQSEAGEAASSSLVLLTEPSPPRCTPVSPLPGEAEQWASRQPAASSGGLKKKSDRGPEGRGGSRATAGQGVETSSRGQPAPSSPPTPRTFQKHRSLRHRRAQSTIVCCCAHDWSYSQAGINWETPFSYQTSCFGARTGGDATSVPLRHVWDHWKEPKGLLGLLSKANVSTDLGVSPKDDNQRIERGAEELSGRRWRVRLAWRSAFTRRVLLSGGCQHKATLTGMSWVLAELVRLCIPCLLSLLPNRTALQLDQSISDRWEVIVFSKDPWRGAFYNFPW